MQAVRLGAVKLDEDFQQDDEEEQTVQQKQAELERPGHGGQRLEGMQGQDARGRQGRRPKARPEAAVQIDPGQQLQGQVAGLGRATIDFSGKNDIQQEHAGEGKQQTLEAAKMPPAASVQQGEHGTSRSDDFSTGTCGSWPAGAADSGAAAWATSLLGRGIAGRDRMLPGIAPQLTLKQKRGIAKPGRLTCLSRRCLAVGDVADGRGGVGYGPPACDHDGG